MGTHYSVGSYALISGVGIFLPLLTTLSSLPDSRLHVNHKAICAVSQPPWSSRDSNECYHDISQILAL